MAQTAENAEAAEHTGGPWRVEGTRSGDPIISAGVNSYGDGPAAYVCILQRMWSLPVKEEDVRLVVAAPDLFKALRRLTFAARTSGGTPGPDAELMAACEAAEAALAKTEA